MCMSTNTLMKARNMRMNMSICMPISTTMSTNTSILTMAHPRPMTMSIPEIMGRMTMNIRGMKKNNMTMIIDA